MKQNVTCDSCGHVLHIRSKAHLAWLTCPRCLAMLKNPSWDYAVAEPRPAPEASEAEPPPARTCSHCGKAIEPTFRVCPYCTASLTPTERQPVPLADQQAGGDMSGLGIGLVLLGLLGVAGVVVFLFNDGLSALGQGSIEGIVLIWGTLLVLPAVGIGLAATSKKPGRGLLIGLTGGMTIAFISMCLPIVLVLAIFISFVNTCGMRLLVRLSESVRSSSDTVVSGR